MICLPLVVETELHQFNKLYFSQLNQLVEHILDQTLYKYALKSINKNKK